MYVFMYAYCCNSIYIDFLNSNPACFPLGPGQRPRMSQPTPARPAWLFSKQGRSLMLKYAKTEIYVYMYICNCIHT